MHKKGRPRVANPNKANMEDNNQTDASAGTCATVQTEQPVIAQQKAAVRRRNGRNRGSATYKQAKTAANASCGEIEDISHASEKLSGSNVNGYAKKPKAQAEEAPAQEAKPENEEIKDAQQCDCQPEHNGPSFEQKAFTPRTIEVGLQDRRPKNRTDHSNDGVVSYSAADEAQCKISFFAKVKAALKSIFGAKQKKSDKRDRKFDKNFKRDFKGKKNYSNNKNFNRNKNFHRKRPNNSNRPRNAAQQQNNNA